MQPWPDTRDTLLARLKDPADRMAWDEFAQVYQPLIYRVACRRGLQDADARDVVQRVLWSVARAAERWPQGHAGGRFRGWLAKVTTNAALNLLQRDARHRATGGSATWDLLAQAPDRNSEVTQLWFRERRMELFRFAAQQVKPSFHPDNWLAFWRTAVDGLPGEQAAQELGKSVGAVYAARSRVMAKLCRAVERIERQEQWDASFELSDAGLLESLTGETSSGGDPPA